MEKYKNEKMKKLCGNGFMDDGCFVAITGSWRNSSSWQAIAWW